MPTENRVLTDEEVYAAMPTSDECEHFTVGDWVDAARRIEAMTIERMRVVGWRRYPEPTKSEVAHAQDAAAKQSDDLLKASKPGGAHLPAGRAQEHAQNAKDGMGGGARVADFTRPIADTTQGNKATGETAEAASRTAACISEPSRHPSDPVAQEIERLTGIAHRESDELLRAARHLKDHRDTSRIKAYLSQRDIQDAAIDALASLARRLIREHQHCIAETTADSESWRFR